MENIQDISLKVERLYLDFDSFFASAEQHFNPNLRGRPVGVLPLDSPHTSCIAISREAKARGVKWGASIAEARKHVPDMIFVVARHDVYVRLHNRILHALETCLPIVHVRSIDEVVCHVSLRHREDGMTLSRRIKRTLADHFSDVLTCSIGLAPTELLAKIGAEMNKPDGCVYLDGSDLPKRLNHLDLNDLPGIAAGMKARLAAAQVYDFPTLWALAPKQARAIWGSVEGERFWCELHGLHAPREKTTKRMFGHSRVLALGWRTPERVKICAQQLTCSAVRRLRRSGFYASRLSLNLRGGRSAQAFRNAGQRQAWNWERQCLPACDYRSFLQLLFEGLARAEQDVAFQPRSVGVVLHGLQKPDMITGDLFENHGRDALGERVIKQRWEMVSDLMDSLCHKYGPDAISLGPVEDIPGGYVGAKIAFGRIPDASDFRNTPLVDHETHFCTWT